MSWVRILATAPWPERRGLNARVLKLDIDPLDPLRRNADRPWTCVIDRRHLTPAEVKR